MNSQREPFSTIPSSCTCIPVFATNSLSTTSTNNYGSNVMNNNYNYGYAEPSQSSLNTNNYNPNYSNYNNNNHINTSNLCMSNGMHDHYDADHYYTDDFGSNFEMLVNSCHNNFSFANNSNVNLNSSVNTSATTTAMSSCNNLTVCNVNVYNNQFYGNDNAPNDRPNAMPQISTNNNERIMPGIPSIPSFDQTPTNTNNMCYLGVTNEPQQSQGFFDHDRQRQPQQQQHVQKQQQHVQQNDFKLFSLTSNNNNHPFIKPSNFIYPTYKQKYVNSATYSASPYNIKNELYRHIHQKEIINNNNEVKIKGSNFESLVTKLTAFGDTARCIECGHSFYEKCHLLAHIREIHLVRSALHECPFCIKTFNQKSNLDTHCMTHAKDRKFSHPFKCIICIKQGKDRCFTRKSSLKRHCQTKHKNVNVECEWIDKQQTPKWNQKLKTFVFNPVKNKINITPK